MISRCARGSGGQWETSGRIPTQRQQSAATGRDILEAQSAVQSEWTSGGRQGDEQRPLACTLEHSNSTSAALHAQRQSHEEKATHTSKRMSMGMFGISFSPPRLPRNCFFDVVLREVDGVADTASAPPAVGPSVDNLALFRGDLRGGIDVVVMPGMCRVFSSVSRVDCGGTWELGRGI